MWQIYLSRHTAPWQIVVNYQPYYLVIEIPYVLQTLFKPRNNIVFPQTHPPHSDHPDTLPYCSRKESLAASKKGIYRYIGESAVERRAQRHYHISNGTLLVLTGGPVCEEFVVAS